MYEGLFIHAALRIIRVPNNCDGELVVIL